VKYWSACEAGSVHIVTPDWIVHCVEALCRVDEIRYHPRLLTPTMSEEPAHQTSSATCPVQSSQAHCPLGVGVPLSSVAVTDTSLYERPHVITANENFVGVSVVHSTPMSQQQAWTRLKSIGNDVCHSPLKPFASNKVCININATVQCSTQVKW